MGLLAGVGSDHDSHHTLPDNAEGTSHGSIWEEAADDQALLQRALSS